MIGDLKPLGVLVEHGIDDVDERFVRREKSVASGEKIAFEHSFHGVFAKHLDDTPIHSKIAAVSVLRKIIFNPKLLGDGEEPIQLVGTGLVGSEHAEVAGIAPHRLGKKESEGTSVFGHGRTWLVHFG